MPRPFRFGVQLSTLPAVDWRAHVERIEALGYECLYWPDHFQEQWEPTTALSAAAAASERLRIGSLVYDVDYRHPVVLAKAAATLQLLSGGRHVFGLGAGWMQSDYDEAGIRFDPASVRIERLEEALQIIRSMWSEERTTFEGRHYQVRDIARAAPLSPAGPPRVLVGGGGPKVLAVAGRHADIVGINPKVHEGRVTATTAADCAPERVHEKIRCVREAAEAAGRDPEVIEFNSLVFVVAITDEPGSLREALASGSGMTVDQVADCPLFLTGSAQEIRERLLARREAFGIHEIVIQGREPDVLERFAREIAAPLRQA